MGRAMERVIAVARECGYLDGLPPFLGPDPFERLPRDKVLALATGSQGEPRAALARIAEDEHPSASLAAGDTVVFSSRTIPGNEKAVGKIINGLVTQGVDVVTDRNRLVHVSGHPRRAELAKMYAWLKPQNRHSRAWRAGASFRARRLRQGAGRARGRARVQRRRRRARRGRRGRDRADRRTAAATRTAKFCCRRATTASSSAASSPSRASCRSRSRSRRRAKCRAIPT